MAETEVQLQPKTRPRPKPPTRRTGQLSGIQIMFAVILAVGLLLAINFSSRIAAGKELFDAYDRVQSEIATLTAEQAKLQRERDFVLNDAYVEQWARDRGKMILPGEKLVVPVPSGSIAEPTPAGIPILEVHTGRPEPQPWQLWWGLFFDTAPPQFNP